MGPQKGPRLDPSRPHRRGQGELGFVPEQVRVPRIVRRRAGLTHPSKVPGGGTLAVQTPEVPLTAATCPPRCRASGCRRRVQCPDAQTTQRHGQPAAPCARVGAQPCSVALWKTSKTFRFPFFNCNSVGASQVLLGHPAPGEGWWCSSICPLVTFRGLFEDESHEVTLEFGDEPG